MDNLKKTRKIIEKHRNIAILPNPKAEKDSFPASLAFFYALKKLGKNVSMLSDKHNKAFDFLTEEKPIKQQQKADFLISINENGAKLSDLFYEKTSTGINLFLKTEGELKKEDVSFEKLSQEKIGNARTSTEEIEVLITIGIPSFNEVQKFLKKDPEYIINIDNNPLNENFGHANVIEEASITVSEVIMHTISFISEDLFDKQISTQLLAGIMKQTSHLKDSLSPQTFQKIVFLVEQWADLKTITEEFGNNINEDTVHLFGEILTKTHFSESRNLGWVLLKETDFAKTNSTPKDLKFTLEKISSSLFPFQNFLILWEQHASPVTVRGVFYSPIKNLSKQIASNFNGIIKGKGVLFDTNEISLQIVKDKVLTILNT